MSQAGFDGREAGWHLLEIPAAHGHGRVLYRYLCRRCECRNAKEDRGHRAVIRWQGKQVHGFDPEGLHGTPSHSAAIIPRPSSMV
jgi:hypothetical protein